MVRKGVRLGSKVLGGIGGEALGNAVGVPIVGTAAGAAGAGLLERGSEGLLGGSLKDFIINRTGKGAVVKGLVNAGKNTARIVGGGLLQKSASR